jgi:hypothetical protein
MNKIKITKFKENKRKDLLLDFKMEQYF